jgi:hypothetical protein
LSRLYVLITATLLSSFAMASTCTWDDAFVSATVKPLDAKLFKHITKKMSLQTIIKKVGPASRDIGSGLHVLEWNTTDGKTFHVSIASACDKPLFVGFSVRR